MSLEFRRLHEPPKLEPAVEFGGPPEDDQPQRADSRNVLVTSGIHRGNFIIGGERIGDVRIALRKLMPIPNDAVAVINGRAVDEDEIICENVEHIAFVKPSAIKG